MPNCNQSLQPSQLQMKCNVWKPCSDQHWQDEHHFSLEDFLSNLPLQTFIYCVTDLVWPTTHNSIWQICPKFQVISSHFFKVDELLMSIEQKLCKVKIFHFQSMLNAIRCIDQRFTFKNSGILCLALIFNLSNPRMTFFYAKKIGCNLQVAKYHDSLPFLSSNQYEPMA